MKNRFVWIWCCANCGFPAIIEDGGFYPEGDRVKNGEHEPGFRIECGLCCHDEFVKETYEKVQHSD